MKSDYSINSYRTSHFQYQNLDKIHGEPTLDSLLHLFRQLKINAQSVPTTLGGGQLGYLALVLSAADYAAIQNTIPFVRPVDPGVFQYVPTPTVAAASAPATTPVTTRTTRSATSGTPTAQRTPGSNTVTPTATITIDIAQQKAQHEERKRQYHECQAVEQALRQQLVEAIEPEYLEALRDPITYMIQDPIPDIITFLQDTYGKITPQELADREDALRNFHYEPWKPVDLVFNKITQYKDLCELCHNQKTDTQLVQLAYLIFNKTRIYTDALKDWNRKPTADKTFANMKTHMRTTYQELKQVGALSIEESALNDRVNLVQELTRHQEDLVRDLKNDLTEHFKTNMVDAMMLMHQTPSGPPSLASESDTNTELTDSVNSVSTSSTLATLVSSIKTLQNELNAMKQTNTLQDRSINPRTGKQWKRYCWTCGCCPHSSKYCPVKAAGHQDDATFRNRKGGSNKNCRPNPE